MGQVGSRTHMRPGVILLGLSSVPGRGSTWDPVRIVQYRGAIVAKRWARLLRRRYDTRLRSGREEQMAGNAHVDVDVISFSCERDLPEQAISIRSFLRWVGQPNSFRVISDGSIRPRSALLLKALSPAVKVVSVEEYAAGFEIPRPVAEFASNKAYGRKLVALLAMRPDARPIVYADSDVLFHPGAAGLATCLDEARGKLLYLQDFQPALDVRLVSPEEQGFPLNSGFLVAGKYVDWTEAVERLDQIGEADAPGYGWTEQSVAHIAYRGTGGAPLPRDRCILELDDRPKWGDTYMSSTTWLRHYVTDVRFKMWIAASAQELLS